MGFWNLGRDCVQGADADFRHTSVIRVNKYLLNYDALDRTDISLITMTEEVFERTFSKIRTCYDVTRNNFSED